MIRDARQHVAQVRFWIQAVEFGRADQAVNRSGAFDIESCAGVSAIAIQMRVPVASPIIPATSPAPRAALPHPRAQRSANVLWEARPESCLKACAGSTRSSFAPLLSLRVLPRHELRAVQPYRSRFPTTLADIIAATRTPGSHSLHAPAPHALPMLQAPTSLRQLAASPRSDDGDAAALS
jgi:hypothetical protein